MLYLDAAATTPVRREALEAMWPYLTGEFGNPSSHHTVGERAAAALADARSRVAGVLGCRPGEVVFTSGGTEGANLAIKGLALANPRGRHLVTTRIEHEAVLASVDYLVRVHGFSVTHVAVDTDGRVRPEALDAALRPDTTLVSIALANNEIGTLQDITSLAAAAHGRGALFHTDAVQAAGWLPVSARDLGVDALSISGHKVGAGKGIGAVYLRGRLPVEPVLHGGGQERERRSGTENVPGAVALGIALSLAEAERDQLAPRVGAARESFIARVLELVPTAVLTGPRTVRLPNHASFCFPGTSGEAVLLELERLGVVSSSGSACAAGSDEPSHVLIAIGVPPEVAQTSVRFTFGREVTEEDLAGAAESVGAAVASVASVGTA
ncbi:cysteine desulfurase family protein [Occultella gossypii]|uniref:cysteine desulfurase n=1 Tax=Occultella gossypii TaxID=2800820 RepID=A0ABS7S8N3_9MICO|nr:cysteine desulfurase family protein [Occultella gossypii]MBZ2196657.1 cysteine desulfurase [Occultella gossypii]